MWKSNDKVINTRFLNNKKALSLVELVVITFVIAIIATTAFPTYKIFQQRSKEKLLKKILTDVRAAINGSKSHNSTTEFEEGFRTVARVMGTLHIEKVANMNAWDPQAKQNCISAFVAEFGKGNGYPKAPDDIWKQNPVANFPAKLTGFYDDGVNPPPELVLGNFTLNRPFYRKKPVHPFHDWFQTANFEYVPVHDGINPGSGATYTYEEWKRLCPDDDPDPKLIGVKDIVSRGVGLALDGSNTNDW